MAVYARLVGSAGAFAGCPVHQVQESASVGSKL